MPELADERGRKGPFVRLSAACVPDRRV